MSQFILLFLIVALNLAVATVLAWKYSRTRDKGFIFLGAAVLIWLRVSGPLERGERVLSLRASQGHWGGFFPFGLISQGQMSIGSLITTLRELHLIIGAGLLLIAVFYLSKTRMDSKA